MLSTIPAVIRRGAGLPGISAVVTMTSTSMAWWAKRSISARTNSSLITLA